ncbi:MAG: NAD-dependent protein deacylase [Planctomycetes bacterium]|nr:NAD-dependent protein deacylase [Planctomycetota bacterium]MCH9727755.1 NAD-dependent protein deacylase [Planctomycetota bacterium]MCH9776920.1 NAD-dependent protein deacylase [Planctomycetota bacterium]MCH9790088.1 NAD-dependent protein deacylase [Planctomycetota bacterium]MDF1744141.1 NAD-dependent protein deacylase [Gimesia sp.]
MSKIKEIANCLNRSKKAIAFTGAGISTESGIPDFRSPGGIWANSQPVYFQDFMASADSRYEYWRQKSISQNDFNNSQPNAGHQILGKWQNSGRLQAIITQNIDGLHQDAGSNKVLELHGTAREIMCFGCNARFGATEMVEKFLVDDQVPTCPACDGLLKHATVSFGQQLPEDILEEAIQLSSTADLYFAIGSSLVVEPAASLPRLAKQNGANLVIINRDETPQDVLADWVIHSSIGETLSAIDECLAVL